MFPRYSTISRAALGHCIFLRVGAPVNDDFQLWDYITSHQYGLEIPLSWGEEDSTLTLVFLSSITWHFCTHYITRVNCDAYFEICISVCTSLSIWYLSFEALAKTLTLPSYTCSSNIKVVHLHSLSRGFSWGSTEFFEYWLNYLSLAQVCRENGDFYYSVDWSGISCFLITREGNSYIVTQKKLSPT